MMKNHYARNKFYLFMKIHDNILHSYHFFIINLDKSFFKNLTNKKDQNQLTPLNPSRLFYQSILIVLPFSYP